MEQEQPDESNPASTADVITQRELASQLLFQNAEYPPRASLLERFRSGARIEPGPLTIVHPYFDLGPFIIPASEGPSRAEQIRRCIRDANVALDDMERLGSATEFSRVAQQISDCVRDAVQERRNASFHARNWAGFRLLVRDHLYAWELTWMLWAADKCMDFRLKWLGSTAFNIASARASALAGI